MKKSFAHFALFLAFLLTFAACNKEKTSSVYTFGIFAFATESLNDDLKIVEDYLLSKGVKNGEILTFSGRSYADCDVKAKAKFDEMAEKLRVREVYDRGLHESTTFVYRAATERNGETFVVGDWNYTCPAVFHKYTLQLRKIAGKSSDAQKIAQYFNSKGLKTLEQDAIVIKDKHITQADEDAKKEFENRTELLDKEELAALPFDSVISVAYLCLANRTPRDTIAQWIFSNENDEK